jgi:hypothetical protein
MVRLLLCCSLAAWLFLAGCARSPGPSNLTVRVTGDAQVYGVYRTNPH